MTSFYAIAHHSAFSTLLAGLATFIGCLGVGDLFLSLLRVRTATLWRIPAAVLTGVNVLALLVFILGIVGSASATRHCRVAGGAVPRSIATSMRSRERRARRSGASCTSSSCVTKRRRCSCRRRR
jgi:hypothetical protein